MNHRFVFFAFLLVIVWTLSAQAQVPNTMSYQGLLTTSLGTPVPDGSYKLQFDLYSVSTGGLSLWTEVDSGITVRKGTFSVVLGSAASLPAIFTQELFVEITALSGPGIGGPMTFSPRSPLTSAPYSLALRTPVSLVDSLGNNTYMLSLVNKDVTSGRGIFVQTNAFVGVKSLAPNLGVGGANDQTLVYYELPSSGTTGYSPYGWGVVGFTDTGVAVAGIPLLPSRVAGYFGGKVVVSTSAGDSALQLPDNSIDSYEILDEPGIASRHHDAYVTLASGLNNVDSLTISSPSTGYVSVEASGICWLSHITGIGSIVDIAVDTAVGFVSVTGAQLGYVASSLPTNPYYQNFSCRRVFATPGGPQKFYLKGDLVSGTGTYYLGFFTIKATYFPTSYGPVSIIAPLASGGSVEQLNPGAGLAPANRGTSSAMQTTDLREMELRALKLREEAERAQNEFLKATLANRKAVRQ